MKTYFYEGQFSPELRSHVLANAPRFQEIMRRSVEAFGGKLVRCHLTAAGSDPIGFLEFDRDISARAWNAYYAKQDGVLSSNIARLLDDDDLVTMAERFDRCGKEAEAHRGGRGA